MSAIADRIATNTVAFHEALQPGATHRGDRQLRAPVIVGMAALPGGGRSARAAPKGKGCKSRAKAAVAARPTERVEQAADAEHTRKYKPSLSQQAQDANTLLTAMNLAQRHAVVRSQKLDGGDQIASRSGLQKI